MRARMRSIAAGEAVLLDELARDDREAEPLVVLEVALGVERAADADVHARGEVDEPLLATRGGTACRAWSGAPK